MTTEDSASAELRGVRRIFLVALAVALVAAGVALVVELTHQPQISTEVSAPPLPLAFRQPGFVEHAVQRKQSAGIAADRRSGTLQLAPTREPLYVVVRCDSGRVTVATDVMTSAQPCTGEPVGVVALGGVRRPTRLRVTVSKPQRAGWAVGIYR